MKRCYAVLNLSKPTLDPDNGIKFDKGPTSLITNQAYNVTCFPTFVQAQDKADEHARAGTVGVIFEMLEAHIVKPTPIEVLTLQTNS
jgi:hypothetical protein